MLFPTGTNFRISNPIDCIIVPFIFSLFLFPSVSILLTLFCCISVIFYKNMMSWCGILNHRRSLRISAKHLKWSIEMASYIIKINSKSFLSNNNIILIMMNDKSNDDEQWKWWQWNNNDGNISTDDIDSTVNNVGADEKLSRATYFRFVIPAVRDRN